MSLPEIAGYELQCLIGGGNCGAVYRGVDSAGNACAIKVFGSMSVNRRTLAATMRALQNMPPHVGVLPVYTYSFDQLPYFAVTPLLGNDQADHDGQPGWRTVTLEHLCGQVAANEAWEYIYELADAIGWMHRSRIPHGNLRAKNVLIEMGQETSVRISDAGQGWVGGVHHFTLDDHWVHLCPDQIEEPEGVHDGQGKSWDVYSFGVLAYRLLTGRFPRADEAWREQQSLAYQREGRGLPYSIDGSVLLDAIRSQQPIVWPTPSNSRWEERRRKIIEKALSLDPAERWSDVREIVRDFERLESDYLIEEAHERIKAERSTYSSSIKRLQTIGAGIVAALFIATTLFVVTFFRAKTAESSLKGVESKHTAQMQSRDLQISSLSEQLADSRREMKEKDTNLAYTQRAADQFLSQLLQTRVSNSMEADFLRQEFEEALVFEEKNLASLKDSPTPNHERVRVSGNLGRIHLRLNQRAEAATHFEKALAEVSALISKAGTGGDGQLHHQWKGQYALMLAEIRDSEGKSADSLKLLKEATADLTIGLEADPTNRMTRFECARAWLEQGIRTRLNGEQNEAISALGKIASLLDAKVIGSDLMNEEKFLLARTKFQRALIERDMGKVEDSLHTLIETAQEMGELVMGTSPRNQDQALSLAETYTEMAVVIAAHFGSNEAKEAHAQAVPILLELIRLHPDLAEAKHLLARNYGSISSLERDEGKHSEAQKKKQDAIELVNEVLSDDKENLRYLFSQAKLRSEYAELLSDIGRTKEALPIAKQATTALETLVGEDNEASSKPERKSCQMQLALTYGVVGNAAQTLKDTKLASESFTKGLSLWEKLSASSPSDPIILQGLTWTKGRLDKVE